MPCIRMIAVPVDAHPVSQSRRNLTRGQCRALAPFAPPVHARRNERYPCVLGTVGLRVVIAPVLRGAATTMVGGDQQMSTSAILEFVQRREPRYPRDDERDLQLVRAD